MFFYEPLASSFGTLRIVWRLIDGEPRVFHVVLPQGGTSARGCTQGAFPGAHPRSVGPVARLADDMRRFFDGKAVDFDLAILALERCSGFQTRVLLAESRIPRGHVSTYGRIARSLGSPQSARAVGGALARNPFPIVIPCHRAIRSDGRLGGFQGGVEMKRALLELEGVEVSPAGRVLTDRFYY